jgi:mannose-6-phosphate isomerase-like protein (cupin superfamily)
MERGCLTCPALSFADLRCRIFGTVSADNEDQLASGCTEAQKHKNKGDRIVAATSSSFHMTVADAAAALSNQAAAQARFVTLLQRGTLSIELYAPQGEDLQQPHRQDELYVVISGHGTFLNGDTHHPFGPGDVLFVPAGVVHRFEQFSPDFRPGYLFGPEGGEEPTIQE